jgi:hypothetical protein
VHSFCAPFAMCHEWQETRKTKNISHKQNRLFMAGALKLADLLH